MTGIERHPRERPGVAGRPRVQQRRLAEPGGSDEDGERRRPRAGQGRHEPRAGHRDERDDAAAVEEHGCRHPAPASRREAGERQGREPAGPWGARTTIEELTQATRPQIVIAWGMVSRHRAGVLVRSQDAVLRVVVADDSYLVREALGHLLDTDPRLDLVAQLPGRRRTA